MLIIIFYIFNCYLVEIVDPEFAPAEHHAAELVDGHQVNGVRHPCQCAHLPTSAAKQTNSQQLDKQGSEGFRGNNAVLTDRWIVENIKFYVHTVEYRDGV